jgi:LmbE family N-acetylglucosaminyl deacetylase
MQEAKANSSAQSNDGKVFVAVQAHVSDVPYYAAGLCTKLMAEGYTGYLIRTTNDETNGPQTNAQNVLACETENTSMAKALGFKDHFDLSYCAHRLNECSPVEFRSRLVFLFRMVKADTVISFNPSSERVADSDQWLTGRAVDEACWVAGLPHDFHEQFEVGGFDPHPVRERYWFYTRDGQPFNQTVDISKYVDKKLDALVECRSYGDGGAGSALRAILAAEGKRLPLLGNDDRSADRAYAREFLVEDSRTYAHGHGFEFAERFYYQGPLQDRNAKVEAYIKKNAVNI